jgi:hypothetical protein
MNGRLLSRLRTVAFAVGVAFAGGAHASATLTNFSDLWWMPSQSGWGLNVAQQDDLMYLTFYVFGRDSQPTWYTALVVHQGTQANGDELFAGPMFRSTGPSHAGPYDPALVQTASVGQAQFRATSTTTASLSYQINDVNGPISTTRAIERFQLREDNLGGRYLGGTSDVTSHCQPAANNGFVSEESGPFTVVHVGTLVEIRGPRCTYVGHRQQTGQVSRIEADYSCSDGAHGQVVFFDVRVEPGGLSGRYAGNGSSCDFSGNIGLARRK